MEKKGIFFNHKINLLIAHGNKGTRECEGKKPHYIIPEVQAEEINKGNTHGLIMNIYLKR